MYADHGKLAALELRNVVQHTGTAASTHDRETLGLAPESEPPPSDEADET